MREQDLRIEILKLIQEDQNITARQIQQTLDLSETDFYHAIRDLRQSGILTHVGMTNSGTWIIRSETGQEDKD